jgi:HSP20 family protein
VFPSIIISADDQRLAVRAEVPGMHLDDFQISVSGDLLTIHGSRQTGKGPSGVELEGGWYHRREREHGNFSRSVRLPANVDGAQAEASYMAGVLTILLPLVEPAKPRHVPVKVAGQ